jgi:hypothetical protein
MTEQRGLKRSLTENISPFGPLCKRSRQFAIGFFLEEEFNVNLLKAQNRELYCKFQEQKNELQRISEQLQQQKQIVQSYEKLLSFILQTWDLVCCFFLSLSLSLSLSVLMLDRPFFSSTYQIL